MAHKADFEEPKAETHPTRGITDAETVTAGLSPRQSVDPRLQLGNSSGHSKMSPEHDNSH